MWIWKISDNDKFLVARMVEVEFCKKWTICFIHLFTQKQFCKIKVLVFEKTHPGKLEGAFFFAKHLPVVFSKG